jgi:aryl-alcohol dehydrogenase-like predicted oxidoreductase
LALTQHTVIATCAELGIPVFGYSPVARGILTSAPLKLEDLPSLSSSPARAGP